ncbi:MAG: type II toxin-antitoxin system prevent-host-death family antitoxin [Pseudomonadota bacterium]
MEQVKIGEARERLDELVERAAAGETIVIERDGKPAARLGPETAISERPTKFDAEKVRRRLEAQKMDTRPQQEIIDEWKRLERY